MLGAAAALEGLEALADLEVLRRWNRLLVFAPGAERRGCVNTPANAPLWKAARTRQRCPRLCRM